MFTFNKETLAEITGRIVAYSAIEADDKVLFTLAYNKIKSVKKEQRDDVVKALNLIVEEQTESHAIQRAVKRIIRSAGEYVDSGVTFKEWDKLEFTSVQKVLQLVTFVNKNHSEEPIVLNDVRESLKGAWEKGISPHRYNNDLVHIVQSLKKKYKVVESEGELKFEDFFSSVKGKVSKLSIDELQALMDYVNDVYEAKEAEVLVISSNIEDVA